MLLNKKVAQYQQASKQYSLLGADPHQVIMILMNAAVDSMAVSKGCNLTASGLHISGLERSD